MKPHILLVHGNWGDSHVWDLLSSSLQKEGYRITALRMPSRGNPAVAWQGFADYVRAVKDAAFQIQLKEGAAPVIAGHSLGGTVALRAATEGCGSALILIAPSPPSNFPQPTFSQANLRLFGPWLLRSIARGSFQWAYRPGLSAMRLLFAGWSEDDFRAEYARMHHDSGRILSEFLRNSLTTRVDLDRISVPALCIAGNADPVSTPGIVQTLARRCGAEYQGVNGSHFLLAEPTLVPLLSKCIGAFLDEKVGAAAAPWAHLRSDWKGSA